MRPLVILDVMMLALCAVIGAGTVWLLPVAEATRLVATVVFAATGVVVAATLLLPWGRLPHRLLFVYPLLGIGSLAVLGAATTGVGPTYLGFIVVSFIIMGFCGSTRGVVALLPVAAVAWLLLNGVPAVALSASFGVRLGIALAVWATVGVLVAERTTRERDQHSALTDDAETDSLTGLGNRRVLGVALDGIRPGDVVVVVDIDRFRDINTARGHGGGDSVLAEFGRTVRVALRGGDHAIRQGGDEFVFVLAGVSAAQVLAVLGRLRDRWQEVCGPVTFSAGAATHDSESTGQETLRRADRCCYQAKAAGRDQWIVDGAGTADADDPNLDAGAEGSQATSGSGDRSFGAAGRH